MYFMGYVELFHPIFHGVDNLSHKSIEEYYLTIFVIKTPIKYLNLLSKTTTMDFETYYSYICENSSKEINYHKNILFFIKNRVRDMKHVSPHPTIRNFMKIQEYLHDPLSLHIVERIVLKTGESICILKTFWIKCIQRKWKKICNHNKKVINEIKQLKNIKKRELMCISSKFLGVKGMWFSRV